MAFTATNGGTCVNSNAAGQYSCAVPPGWSGSITPWLTGYSFAPVSRNFTNVTGALTGQDFTATEGGAAAGIFYVHADHLNTPRLITNQAGQAVWRWDQTDPFGGNVANDNPSGLGTFTFNLRFPGQYFDNETNLHYNYFRDCYDPGTGRYCQSDPIGLAGGINTYAYVGGNPLSLADPLGLFFTTVDAFCLQRPDFCLEVAGQIVENTSQITEGCVTEDSAAAAQALRQFGVAAAVIGAISAAPRAISFVSAAPGAASVLPNLGSKLNFMLGNATGGPANIARSQAMARQLQSIGLGNNSATRQYLREQLSQSLQQQGRLQANGRTLRETLLMGPGGGLKMQSIWEEEKLITVILFGGR